MSEESWLALTGSVEPVGAHNSVVGADQGFRAPSWDLMCRILYRFLALLARLAVRSGRSKDFINEYRRAA